MKPYSLRVFFLLFDILYIRLMLWSSADAALVIYVIKNAFFCVTSSAAKVSQEKTQVQNFKANV